MSDAFECRMQEEFSSGVYCSSLCHQRHHVIQYSVSASHFFHPFALVRGRAAARWRLGGARAEIEPLEQLAPGELAALQRDGRSVQRYLGLI